MGYTSLAEDEELRKLMVNLSQNANWKNYFVDYTSISVKAGDGGDGCIAFLREKFRPKGGPCGGDGGRGGRVFLVAVDDIYTLEDFRQKRSFSAEKGGDGGIRQRTGKQGKDLSLDVPVGTLVYDQEDGALLADLTEVGARALVAHGGRGGWGNRKFATSTNQSPRYAQQGHSGEKVSLLLDLALLADVGLIGLPNAGKSTFLSVISQAKPKIAAYPFTTLAPVLGVVGEEAERFTIADLPGLVEGAHEGVGLGLDFLKHVKRCRVLVHLVDGNELDPAVATSLVEAEVLSYDPLLSDLLRIVVVTKADIDAAVCEQSAALLREAGHAVVCVGYDDDLVIQNTATGEKTKGALKIRNSWGTGWGEDGYGWLPYKYVEDGLARDWWSLIKSEWIDTEQFGQ